MSNSREDKERALAAHKMALLKERYKRDIVAWLRECVKTVDEHDLVNPVKPFPIKPYIRPLVYAFETEKVFYVAKSRQIMISWLMVCLCLHHALFFPHRLVLLISEKEDKAIDLIKRIRMVYNQLPMWMKNVCALERPWRDQAMTECNFKNGSMIKGLPQGPDQIRAFTASLIFVDEAGAQDKLEETLGACGPSIMGGGKMMAVGTAAPGHFETLCGSI